MKLQITKNLFDPSFGLKPELYSFLKKLGKLDFLAEMPDDITNWFSFTDVPTGLFFSSYILNEGLVVLKYNFGNCVSNLYASIRFTDYYKIGGTVPNKKFELSFSYSNDSITRFDNVTYTELFYQKTIINVSDKEKYMLIDFIKLEVQKYLEELFSSFTLATK